MVLKVLNEINKMFNILIKAEEWDNTQNRFSVFKQWPNNLLCISLKIILLKFKSRNKWLKFGKWIP